METKKISVTLHARAGKSGTPYLLLQVGVLRRSIGSSVTIDVTENVLLNLISPNVDEAILKWLTQPIPSKPETPNEEE